MNKKLCLVVCLMALAYSLPTVEDNISVDINKGLAITEDIASTAGTSKVGCWRNSFIRGIGEFQDMCPKGKIREIVSCHSPCEDGWKGIGFLCWKDGKAKYRGIGTLPNGCSGDRELQGGLCYKKCPSEFKGEAGMCVQKKCSGDHPFECGALCMKTSDGCTSMIISESMKGFSVVTNAIANPLSLVGTGIEVIKLLASFPKCKVIGDPSP